MKSTWVPQDRKVRFWALRDRLPHFADAGYTVLEIMPINEFSGILNWGYDGRQSA